ncbi:MAG: LegC family aminotransferase [Bacteroidota bacterium]
MILLSGPNISGNEWKYVKECLDTAWVSSAGSYVSKFEEMVADFSGAKYGVATVNGTAALHISLQLSGVERDDLVILPNITFVASANAVKYIGAQPIFIDIDEFTWQMDLDILENYLSSNTELKDGDCFELKSGNRIKAIMPVHVLGNMCDMERLLEIAATYHLEIVEDSTEALGSYFKNKHAGSFGKFGCFSFNGNKIISTGGGGMIVTDDEALAKKAKHLTTQAKVDSLRYYHDEIGYNYRLVNVLAAIGVAQMEQLPGFIKRKKEIDAIYRTAFEGLADIRFQEVNEHVDPNCWLFTFRTEYQKSLLNLLNERKLQSRPFWLPMNQLPMYRDNLYINDEDISGKVVGSCLSIPCSTYLTDQDVELVVNTVREGIFVDA